jgi:hypothetical protein
MTYYVGNEMTCEWKEATLEEIQALSMEMTKDELHVLTLYKATATALYFVEAYYEC